jgi:hypothetical protein
LPIIWVRLLVRHGFKAVNFAKLLQGSIGGQPKQSSLVSVLSRVENALDGSRAGKASGFGIQYEG